MLPSGSFSDSLDKNSTSRFSACQSGPGRAEVDQASNTSTWKAGAYGNDATDDIVGVYGNESESLKNLD